MRSLSSYKVADDPWKLLVAVMLLNKTAGKNSIPIFWEIVERWPTPENLSQADVDELRVMIQPLGLQSLRAKRLISLSSAYLADPPRHDRLHTSRAKIEFVQLDLQTQRPKFVHTLEYPRTPVSHLPGCGPYALDSYRIFCMPDEEWKKVMPTDKELIRYIKWKWAFEGCRWEPVNGLVAPLDSDYLEALPSILSC
ncbi:DNA glycosylase [Phellopilus nigrolimitatus]|nr:DNA glycosylase [Phellopilus nigrolimitatus]